MRELNWPKHLAARPATQGRRGLAVAGSAILLAAVGLTAWFADGSLPKPQATAQTPAPAAPQVTVILPAAEEPPTLSTAEVVRSAPPADDRKPEPAKAAVPAAPTDWATVAQDELKSRAEANEIPAMEEMARRLIQGIGVPKDQQGGAGWLVRAAQVGSPQSAFNVGVMYERGFVVERDSTRAAEWYRKAADANVPMARHNLALLLRDGKGSARNVPEAIVLLRAAAKQGMSASMFTLGDIYERGDAGAKDLPLALAWFAITAEFERQASKGVETPLTKTATQRAQALQRTLTPAELEKARLLGQAEFKMIVDALSLSLTPQIKPEPPQAALPPPALPADPPGWRTTGNTGDQIRAIQQALFDLKLVRDKPDGAMGPNTRTAIRQFQRSVSMRETGEPTREVYGALKETLSRRDTVANSPLPAPPPQTAKIEPEKTDAKPDSKPEAKPETRAEPPKAEAAKPAPAPARIDPPKPEPPRIVETKPTLQAPEPQINIGQAPPPPPPPTSADIARSTPRPPPDPDAWPAAAADQIKAVQALLRELNFYTGKADGQAGSATKAAIREYERASGLKESGEPGKALFDSLKEMRALMKR